MTNCTNRRNWLLPSSKAITLTLASLSWLLILWPLVAHCSAAEIVFVKVLVDEEEVTKRKAWERRLTNRIHAASDVIARYADVRFVVREYGTWQSDDRIQDFSRTLTEFEQEVDPGKGRLAIGFSSQYRFQRGQNHLGGTRGPLRHHILIRENAPTVREVERLEVLVHELGHFLGAAHSTSPTSVMHQLLATAKPG